MADPRLTPARAHIAASHLKGSVTADRFSDGTAQRVVTNIAPIMREPSEQAARETELLFGEDVVTYEEANGWSFIQAKQDGYAGYVQSKSLALPLAPSPASGKGNVTNPPTHKVRTLRTYIFSQPDIKSPPIHLISLEAPLQVKAVEGRFAELAEGGYVVADHLREIEHYADDFVAIAQSFLGTPYLWGGRSSFGLDCSALVQLSLAACGVKALRDTDMQENSLGQHIDDKSARLRGDLVFWKGHVAIVIDDHQIVHANGTAMMVSIDPLTEFCDKVRAESGEITSIKRVV